MRQNENQAKWSQHGLYFNHDCSNCRPLSLLGLSTDRALSSVLRVLEFYLKIKQTMLWTSVDLLTLQKRLWKINLILSNIKHSNVATLELHVQTFKFLGVHHKMWGYVFMAPHDILSNVIQVYVIFYTLHPIPF